MWTLVQTKASTHKVGWFRPRIHFDPIQAARHPEQTPEQSSRTNKRPGPRSTHEYKITECIRWSDLVLVMAHSEKCEPCPRRWKYSCEWKRCRDTWRSGWQVSTRVILVGVRLGAWVLVFALETLWHRIQLYLVCRRARFWCVCRVFQVDTFPRQTARLSAGCGQRERT